MAKAMSLMEGDGTESPSAIRNELGDSMELGIGIYRTAEGMQQTIDKIAELVITSYSIHYTKLYENCLALP